MSITPLSEYHYQSSLIQLSGEHIDYVLFGVFPAAIEQDVLIALAPRANDADEEENDPGRVTAENQNNRYTRQTFAPMLDESNDEWRLDIDKEQLRWESYVKAGYYVGVDVVYALRCFGTNEHLYD